MPSSLALSPSGKVIAAGYEDGMVRFWNASTRQQIGVTVTVAAATDQIDVMAFSPDGQTLAIGSDDGAARLVDVKTAQTIGEPLIGPGFTGAIQVLSFSPDGRTLVVGAGSGTRLLHVDYLVDPWRTCAPWRATRSRPPSGSRMSRGWDIKMSAAEHQLRKLFSRRKISVLVTVALVAGCLTFAMSHWQNADSSVLDLSGDTAWLVSTVPGLVSEVSAAAGTPDADVTIADIKGHSVRVAQDASTVLVADENTGIVHLINASSFTRENDTSLGPENSSEISDGMGIYGIDSANGSISYATPMSSSDLKYVALNTPAGNAEVASDGTLWVTEPLTGAVVPVRDGVGRPGARRAERRRSHGSDSRRRRGRHRRNVRTSDGAPFGQRGWVPVVRPSA